MSDAFEEQLEALSLLDGLKKEVQAAEDAREANSLTNAQASRSNRGKLKSDLRKSTAFVKKIKAITPEALQQCIRDTETLNLTLYISEIVSALLESKFKFNEVPGVVSLCAKLHHKYDDFTSPLISGLKESLLQLDNDGKRKRVQIRFLIELYQVGIFTEDSFFRQLIRFITGKQTKDSTLKATGAIDLSSLVTYVKYGAEILMGYVPRRLKMIAKQAGKSEDEIPSKLVVPPTTSNEIRMQVLQATEKLAVDLVTAHRDVRQREAKNEKDKILHGSLSEQKQAEFDNSTKLYEKLLSSLTSLQEATGLDLLPELKEEEEEDVGKSGISLHIGGSSSADMSYGPYGDAESRAFYEDLPDLLSLVPLSVLGLTPEQATEMRERWKTEKEKRQEEDTIASTDDSVEERNAEDRTQMSDNVKAKIEDSKTENQFTSVHGNDEVLEDEMNVYMSLNSTYNAKTLCEDQDEQPEASETPTDSPQKAKIIVLLQETLPSIVTQENADDVSVSYCYLNTKRARKNLVSALSKVPRNRFDLIPLYARIVASLSRLFPDIVPPLVDSLHKDFFGMYKAKNQMHVEGKIKNMRYIGELVKFRVVPPIMAFKIFRKLLLDFHHHNVDLMATLLETCGRFLYLLPVTNARLENVLEAVMRHRRGRNMDLRQQQLLEAAYFMVKPPDRHVVQKRVYSEIQQYARHLIFTKLASNNVEYVIKQLRKLPWYTPEEEMESIVVKATLKLSRKKYTNVPLATDCIAGIAKYYPNLIVRLVDTVFEELTRGMSSSHKSDNQRLLTYIRLMGELYNFSALPAGTIFDLLHFIVSFGYKDIGLPELYVAATGAGKEGGKKGDITDNGQKNLFVPTVPESASPADIINALVVNHTCRYFELVPPEVYDTNGGANNVEGKSFASVFKGIDIDPPRNVFRIQMVCELLNCCAVYFMRGSLREKLDEFLLYFQRYLLSKPILPSHVEFAVLDLYDTLEQYSRDELRRSLKDLLIKEKEKSKGGGKKRKANPEIRALKEKIANPSASFARLVSYEEVEGIILARERKKQEDAEKIRVRISAYHMKKGSEQGPSSLSEEGADIDMDGQEKEVEDDDDLEEDVNDDDEDDDDGEDDYRSRNKHSTESVDEDDEDEDDDQDEKGGVSFFLQLQHFMLCVDIDGDDDEVDMGDDGDLSNEEAARLMNELRVKEEEDEQFEMAFKSLMFESVSKAAAPKATSIVGGSGNVKLASANAFSGDRMGKSERILI